MEEWRLPGELSEELRTIAARDGVMLGGDEGDGLGVGRVLKWLDTASATWRHRTPLGLELARRAPLLTLGELGLGMRASEDLRRAYERLARYHGIDAPFIELELDEIDGGARLTLRCRLPERPGLSVVLEASLGLLVRVGREMSGVEWSPLCVEFPHRVEHREAWREHFGTPVRVGTTASMTLSRDVLALQGTRPDKVLTSYLDRRAEQRLTVQPKATLPLQVRNWLRPRLWEAPTSARCARALGMSRRTMQRRLGAYRTSYSEELERLRKAHAEDLLGRGERTSDVAVALGYADTSSFCRAYRRWFGAAPGSRHCSSQPKAQSGQIDSPGCG